MHNRGVFPIYDDEEFCTLWMGSLQFRGTGTYVVTIRGTWKIHREQKAKGERKTL
jgi:hypothetical protein